MSSAVLAGIALQANTVGCVPGDAYAGTGTQARSTWPYMQGWPVVTVPLRACAPCEACQPDTVFCKKFCKSEFVNKLNNR